MRCSWETGFSLGFWYAEYSVGYILALVQSHDTYLIALRGFGYRNIVARHFKYIYCDLLTSA